MSGIQRTSTYRQREMSRPWVNSGGRDERSPRILGALLSVFAFLFGRETALQSWLGSLSEEQNSTKSLKPEPLRYRAAAETAGELTSIHSTAKNENNGIPEKLSDHEPLRGLPPRVKVDGVMVQFGPFPVARQAAETYCRLAGITPKFPLVYAKLNKARSAEIAKLYDQMQPMPNDPETIAAYNALCVETLAQWQVIKTTGFQVEYTGDEQPYSDPRKVIMDIVNNNHLYVTPTRSAFGDTAFEYDPSNPLLAETDEQISGTPALVNDIFRIVHDYFGHTKEGLGFRAEGEENAWRCHAAMFSPLARRAMATELRGQNSWINYGPFGEKNRKAGMDETQFAPQKMGLLPEWVAWVGAEDP